MKSKMSFFNTAIILEDLKRYWGIAVLYFLSLFFSTTLDLILLFNPSDGYYHEKINNFLELRHANSQMMFSIIFPILLSVLLFRYLQQSKSTTLLHSFPVTRGQLFHSHNIAGVLLLILPTLFIGVIFLVFLNIHHDGSELFKNILTVSKVFRWAYFSILTNLVVYFISVLVSMVTGISLIQIILSFIAIFLPTGISMLLTVNFKQLLYGFAVNEQFLENFVTKIIPITSFLSDKTINDSFLWWYILLNIILYFLAYIFYQKRALESASDPIAFNLLKPIFKYGFTFCSMILSGAYFYMLEKIDSWLYMGYFIGAFLGYIIAEMIIQKSIWIFKNLKGFVLYTMIILLVFVGIKFDFIGYEKNIPNSEDIESVYYGNGLYDYWEEDRNYSLKTSENIDLVRDLHSQIIKNKEIFAHKEENVFLKYIGIAYKLKNGKTLTRGYSVPKEFAYKNVFIPKIYESKEYKMSTYDIFHLDLDHVNYIRIHPESNHNADDVKIVDPNEILNMTNALKADLLDQTYEESIDNKNSWASIQIYMDKEKDLDESHRRSSIHISWEKHYKYFPKWLKENGYYEKSRVLPENIASIIIEKANEETQNFHSYNVSDLAKELTTNKDKKRLEIKDQAQMEKILFNTGYGYGDTKNYIIGIYFTNGDSQIEWMTQENAPEFVKGFFK
ncbi:MAG: ABC transporter permease [Marinisporobacter sp.]|jgi:ABC-2 type transport system permease protein|nr:ABC transporter permease [Marinisporobacter sp.]